LQQKTAIIIGAGPAGLTAAYELLERTDIKPIVYEANIQIGGLAKTVNYKGNRIDIGPHRFFSKSDRVLEWWQKFLPVEKAFQEGNLKVNITYQNKIREIQLDKQGPDPEEKDEVMLIRNRFTRIYFLNKFFQYPLSINFGTFFNLGLFRTFKILASYILKSLRDFFINRFGNELYKTFFKDYTEKVWGISCDQIEPEWGAQRVKNLSMMKAIIYSFFRGRNKKVETSLIEHFLYPKFGTGQMWAEVAKKIVEKGGEILTDHAVQGLKLQDKKIAEVEVKNLKSNEILSKNADYVFSSMAVRDLVECLDGTIPKEVKVTANGLHYRDFISVGLLLKKLKVRNNTKLSSKDNIIPDNWIYVQDKNVKLGRIVIYNNFSPYMLDDKSKIWIGCDYFCNEGDHLWEMDEKEMFEFVKKELISINFIFEDDIIDWTIIKEKKAYPAYYGSYKNFDIIRNYFDKVENLFLIGRNGMHKYNNQDHSMLTAMTAVENIISGKKSKENIWEVNTEREYHEAGK